MNLNLEEERVLLEELRFIRNAQENKNGLTSAAQAVFAQRKLVAALEQLDQAREVEKVLLALMSDLRDRAETDSDGKLVVPASWTIWQAAKQVEKRIKQQEVE